MRNLNQYNYNNKRVLLRVDLNVPVSEGEILDYTRIDKIIPTIKYLLERNAKIILISHFGRPKRRADKRYSLNFMREELSKRLEQEVHFCSSIIGEEAEKLVNSLKKKEILLLENLRFYPGEMDNDLDFATELAKLADYYINDAFSCSHRSHASIVKIAELLPSCAGLLLIDEVQKLNIYLLAPDKPIIAIIGGSKISTKIDLLYNLIEKVDYLVIGGAMANTFLKAQDYETGTSLYEEEFLDVAEAILTLSKSNKCQIILPEDVVVAKIIADNANNKVVDINSIPNDQMILDIGPSTSRKVNQILQTCKTVICNGPLGVFEYFPFSSGTININQEIAKLTNQKKLISIAGGGDMVAALSKAGLFNEFTYISTAGGAFLEWLENNSLPGLEVLED